MLNVPKFLSLSWLFHLPLPPFLSFWLLFWRKENAFIPYGLQIVGTMCSFLRHCWVVMTLPKERHRWRETGWYCWYSHTSDSSLHGHTRLDLNYSVWKHLWKTEQHRAPRHYKPGTERTTSAEPCVCSVALQGTQAQIHQCKPTATLLLGT